MVSSDTIEDLDASTKTHPRTTVIYIRSTKTQERNYKVLLYFHLNTFNIMANIKDLQMQCKITELRSAELQEKSHREKMFWTTLHKRFGTTKPEVSKEELIEPRIAQIKRVQDASAMPHTSSSIAYINMSMELSDMLPTELRDMIYGEIMPSHVKVRKAEAGGIFFENEEDGKRFDLADHEGLGPEIYLEFVVRFYRTAQFTFEIPSEEENIALFLASDTSGLQLDLKKLVSKISLDINERHFTKMEEAGHEFAFDTPYTRASPPITELLMRHKAPKMALKRRLDFLTTLLPMDSKSRILSVAIEYDVRHRNYLLNIILPILQKLKSKGWRLCLKLEDYKTALGRCANFTEDTLVFETKGCLEGVQKWLQVSEMDALCMIDTDLVK
ncbi:hypothetical protein J4E93_007114 [Alternaria ventricosa]|uniref:uncharacterized protein n=1 Tax=Alternaria ventricosa TaxID=1187951 RepID=UPI0020C5279D|nr:uncharacterized protein J4E93_007114 [Alternaria ventricosa]KAI4643045.1 hypothetical protein J4E93_007114 [Alternaria ventricosa]